MMRIVNHKFVFVFIGLAIASANTVSAATLTTPLSSTNSNDGIMFDIKTAGNALTLTSIGVNIFGTANYEIYYKAGSIAGSFTDISAWTLLNSFSNVVGFGTDYSQPSGIVDFDITDLALAANSTYGLYITQTVGNQGSTSGLRYTSAPGTTLTTPVISDSYLTIQTGRGKEYPITGPTTGMGRAFNGSLTYSVNAAVPEPATWGMMMAGFGAIGVALRRRQQVRFTYA